MNGRRTKKEKNPPVLKHGDTFHVYIAAGTSQEVCDFLTQLKCDGDFSQEILAIIETHVKALDPSVETSTEELMMDRNKQQGVYTTHSFEHPLERVNDLEPAPKRAIFDPIEALRQQRKAWVAKESND